MIYGTPKNISFQVHNMEKIKIHDVEMASFGRRWSGIDIHVNNIDVKCTDASWCSGCDQKLKPSATMLSLYFVVDTEHKNKSIATCFEKWSDVC